MYEITPISDNQFIKNKNNIKCDLNFDNEKFNKLLTKFETTIKPFTVICALGVTAGFGDLIFFVNFVKYLSQQYSDIKINIVIPENKKQFICSNLNIGKIYSDKSEEVINSDINNMNLYVSIQYSEDNVTEIRTSMEIDGDILFIPPKTKGLNIQYTKPDVIRDNSYTLSEYNPLPHGESSITTGIKNKAGLLLDNYKNSINQEKEEYSISYIYTLKYMVQNEFRFKPSEIRFKIDDTKIWDLKTLFDKLNIKINNELLLDKYYEDLQEYEEHGLVVYIKICINFRDYLNELDKLSKSVIKVYYRGESFENLKEFLNSLSKKKRKILNLTSLYNYFFNSTRFKFVQLPPKTHDEMLILYEHSLPVVFISGDQSLTDFISVNKYHGYEFKNDIYYQIFYWKSKLAKQLGGKEYICCKIPKETLRKIYTNPDNDFRYKGMIYIQSVLLYALEYKLRLAGIKENICIDLDSADDISKLVQHYSVPNYKRIYSDYMSNGDKNNNLLLKIKKNKLEIMPNSKPFNIDMILGKINNQKFASWLIGTKVPDIYIKYNDIISSEDTTVTNLKCNSLIINIPDSEVVLPKNIHILVIYIILEYIRHERYIDQNLIRTFGSFILSENECNKEVKDKINVIIEDKTSINTILFQENVEGKYIQFSEYLKTIDVVVDMNILSEIIDNVSYVLLELQKSEYKIVHNNLTCDNIYINFGYKKTVSVKIINFDNASFSINNKRFSTKDSVQKEFSNSYDINTFFEDIYRHIDEY